MFAAKQQKDPPPPSPWPGWPGALLEPCSLALPTRTSETRGENGGAHCPFPQSPRPMLRAR